MEITKLIQNSCQHLIQPQICPQTFFHGNVSYGPNFLTQQLYVYAFWSDAYRGSWQAAVDRKLGDLFGHHAADDCVGSAWP